MAHRAQWSAARCSGTAAGRSGSRRCPTRGRAGAAPLRGGPEGPAPRIAPDRGAAGRVTGRPRLGRRAVERLADRGAALVAASCSRCWRGRGARGCHARDPGRSTAALVRDVAQERLGSVAAVAVVGSPVAPAAALAFPARLGAHRSVARSRRRPGAAGARTEITRTARATHPSTAPCVPAILDT